MSANFEVTESDKVVEARMVFMEKMAVLAI